MKIESQLSTPKSQTSKLSYGDYLRFRDLVLERSGLYFPEKKKTSLEAGLLKALTASPLGFTKQSTNLDAYYNLLRDKNDPAGKAEMERLIHTLTIGETHFFRDEAQFDALATRVLPAIIDRKRATAAAVDPKIQPQLRIWSAGCATGEEPYSLAILLKELLPDIDRWHILILATDINQDSLTSAREGLYSEWSFRETQAKALRPRFFTYVPATKSQSGAGRYRLRDDIRPMVTFASLNLIEDDYPAIHNNTVSMDLILCRNVTIYFTEEATRQIVQRFYEVLVEGGWLVVGHSEPSPVIYRTFQTRAFSNTLLYQKTNKAQQWSTDKESNPVEWEWLDRTDDLEAQPTLTKQTEDPPSLTFNHEHLDPHPNGTSPSAVSATFSPQSSIDPYELAGVLLSKGYVKEAIDKLHHKLIEDPNFAPAHSLLGRAYANMGRWAEAEHWCQRALEIDRLLAEPYYILGLVYQHEDQIEPAIHMLKKAVYLDRQAPLPHFNLAMLHKKLGQTKKAERAFHNALSTLEKCPPDTIISDSGGATVKHLTEIVRRILSELKQKREPRS